MCRRGSGLPPNAVPLFFRDPHTFPALFHQKRAAMHAPGNPPVFPDLCRLDQADYVRITNPQELRDSNNRILHSVIKQISLTNVSYFASFPEPVGRGGRPPSFVPNFESQIHMSVHFFMGDQDNNWHDMGQGYSAAKDPIFGSHHANVDRMWTVWEALGDLIYDDPDFLDAEFFFYNEHAQLVRVTVADCLDIGPLG